MLLASFLGFLLLFLLIGFSSVLVRSKEQSDYLLAGSSVPPSLIGLSAVATTWRNSPSGPHLISGGCSPSLISAHVNVTPTPCRRHMAMTPSYPGTRSNPPRPDDDPGDPSAPSKDPLDHFLDPRPPDLVNPVGDVPVGESRIESVDG